jgi:kinesin family protein C2/C3
MNNVLANVNAVDKNTQMDIFELQSKLAFTTQKLDRAEQENTKLREQCQVMELKYAEEKATVRRLLERQLQEQKEKKELFNLVQELKGNIRVFVRIRPLLKSDGMTTSSIKCNDDEVTLTDKSFKFERVFCPKSSQIQVFDEVKALATSLLDGYNVCIFAYGATGSGKTHTMAGTPTDPGVTYRMLQELFDRITWRGDEYIYQLNVGVLEIYNETVVDLLSKEKTKVEVSIANKEVKIPKLTMVSVTEYDEVVKIMREGSKNRVVGSNNLNEHSSRSHLITTVHVTATHVLTEVSVTSKLYLIDLAGSERLKRTGASGDRAKESAAINKSLSALSDVFTALSQKSSHIPYRNSKLTSILMDSLGNENGSKVLMVVNVNPAAESATETVCSLGFASRARQVEIRAKKGK